MQLSLIEWDIHGHIQVDGNAILYSEREIKVDHQRRICRERHYSVGINIQRTGVDTNVGIRDDNSLSQCDPRGRLDRHNDIKRNVSIDRDGRGDGGLIHFDEVRIQSAEQAGYLIACHRWNCRKFAQRLKREQQGNQ